jgi:hypothetical protein
MFLAMIFSQTHLVTLVGKQFVQNQQLSVASGVIDVE